MIPGPQSAIERKRRLFEKSKSNLQRRHRESLLSSLPSDLSNYLQHSECVYTPESHGLISQFHPAWPNGIGYEERFVPKGYEYVELGWVNSALAVVDRLGTRHDKKQALLLFDQPSVSELEGKLWLVPDIPLFCVDFGWARAECGRLLPFSGESFSIVARDLSAGIVIDHVWGVLHDPPNPEGVGFEVFTWA